MKAALGIILLWVCCFCLNPCWSLGKKPTDNEKLTVRKPLILSPFSRSGSGSNKKKKNESVASSNQPSSSLSAASNTNTDTQDEEEKEEEPLGPPESLQLRPRVVTLNIMVAGLSGLGKSTMCQQLLESWEEAEVASRESNPFTRRKTTTRRNYNDRSIRRRRMRTTTVAIDPHGLFERYDEQANTILKVRIIDTPGFGNRVNHRHSVKPITDYIAKCRQAKFAKEMSSSSTSVMSVEPTRTEDSLVHVCLYFLSPGRFLAIDQHFLKQVQKEVTIVPVIAKADTLTDEEIAQYRAELADIFKRERIRAYNFDQQVESSSLSSSTTITTPTTTKTTNTLLFQRGRRSGEVLAVVARNGKYPWGNSYCFDPAHSDLRLIRDLLLSEHTERFLELALVKYAKYRSFRITRRKVMDGVKLVTILGLVLTQLTMNHHPVVMPAVQNILSSSTLFGAKLDGMFRKQEKAPHHHHQKDEEEQPTTTVWQVDHDGSKIVGPASSPSPPMQDQKAITSPPPGSSREKGRGRRQRELFGLFGTPVYGSSSR